MGRRLTILGITGIMATAGSMGCGGGKASGPRPEQGVRVEAFGTVQDRPISVYTLRNARGMEARVMNFGGVLLSLKVPDRAGQLGDVVLGFDSLAPYRTRSPYFGALVGRYGNRIAKARFTLDGSSYRLPANDGANTLHGGPRGFDKVVWEAEPFARSDARGVVLRYTSPDGEMGFPGTLRATVTYTLTDAGELVFDYQATTDRATPVNLTQHTYFNLTGDPAHDVLGHELTIVASRFTPVDGALIPTGELRGVAGTPFDFRQPTAIGARIQQPDPQLQLGRGYDHNFVLDHAPAPGGAPALAAHVYEPTSGRVLDVLTTEPGVQFYSGNFLNRVGGKDGAVYGRRSGFCLETQHFPDSPNQPSFPSTILRPGEGYRTRTIYRFSVQG